MPVKGKRDTEELSWVAKSARGVLMSVAPSCSVSTNELFNSGYGGIVTVIFQGVFVATFLYYSVLNTQENLGRHYLSPLNTADPGICNQVPISITDSFVLDMNVSWASEENFKFSESVYNLQLAGVSYEDGEMSYASQMSGFIENLATVSAKGLKRDFGYNVVFAGTYGAVNFDHGGVANLYVDSDVRIMFDEVVYSGGFSNIDGICDPVGSSYYYDRVKGSFVMDIIGLPTEDGDIWNPCPGFISPVSDFGYLEFSHPPSFSLEIDSATAVTAFAINNHMTSVDLFTPLKTEEQTDLNTKFVAYIDPFYSPMQPFYCIKASDSFQNTPIVWPYESDDVCFLFIGSMIALPIITHSGNFGSCWRNSRCTCESPNARQPHYEPGSCNSMYLTLAFVFIPYAQQEEGYDPVIELLKIMIAAHTLNPVDPDIGLIDFTYQAINTANNANFYHHLGVSLDSAIHTNESFLYAYDAPHDTCPSSLADGLLEVY